jgi:predicted DNA binding CopG/RHH family protein
MTLCTPSGSSATSKSSQGGKTGSTADSLKDETVKITIALSKTSVEFFKQEAKKHNTQYQKMIRRLLDEYAAHQQ